MTNNINIILTKDVPILGNIGELCNVKPGYARNFLFPKQFALPVSPERLKEFEHQKKLVAHKLLRLRTKSEKLKSRIEQLILNITAKAGQRGKIFGSIGTRAIESALAKKGFKIDHRNIKIDSPLKTLGLHTVTVRLEGNIKTKIKIMIISENIEETKKSIIEKVKNSQQDANSPN